MSIAALNYSRTYKLDARPTHIWPILADSNRLFRDLGLPTIELLDPVPESHYQNGRSRAQCRWLGMRLEWDEMPCEWHKNSYYRIERHYRKGPLHQLTFGVQLDPIETGTIVKIDLNIQPASNFYRILIQLYLHTTLFSHLRTVIDTYDVVATTGYYFKLSATGHSLPKNIQNKLHQLHGQLASFSNRPEVVTKLIQLIQEGDPLTLRLLRPHELASRWDLPREDILTVMLYAVYIQLLEFRWDAVCPHCRQIQASSSQLSGIREIVNCSYCRDTFTVALNRNLEINFQPNSNIRSIQRDQFSISSPQSAPFIITQFLLEAGSSKTLDLVLPESTYRLRTLKQNGNPFLKVKEDGPDQLALSLNSRGWEQIATNIGANVQLTLNNRTDSEQLFIIEHVPGSDQRLTGNDLTTRQLFRSLFPDQTLRDEEKISAGSLTFMFTDLVDSTLIYRSIGDGDAFDRVMQHFDIIEQVIKKEHGAIIKTLGDAVMAVFLHPDAAIRTILRIQMALKANQNFSPPLQIKAGIHHGQCIAVNQNQQLDYFGSTVNMAARLVDFAHQDEIILSEFAYEDPGVQQLIENHTSGLSVKAHEAELKGFPDEAYKLWKIRMQKPENVKSILS